MNTLIEDASKLIGCTDKEVFIQAVIHEGFNNRTITLANFESFAERLYNDWKRKRIITQILEDYCLYRLTSKRKITKRRKARV